MTCYVLSAFLFLYRFVGAKKNLVKLMLGTGGNIMGNVYGYVRVSSIDQNEDRQLIVIQNCFHLWQSVNENKCVSCIDETDISFDCRKCLYQQRRISDNNPF